MVKKLPKELTQAKQKIVVQKPESLDFNKALDCLCRSFEGDAVSNWIFRKDLAKKDTFDLFYGSFIDLCLPKGEILVAGDYSGVALWFEPGKMYSNFCVL